MRALAAIRIGQGEPGLTPGRDCLHKSAISLLALLESLDLVLKLLAGRLMDTGCLATGGIQITPGLLHLLIDGLEGLLKFCLRQVLVCAVDDLALTAIDGQAFCLKEIQLPAKKDKLSEESWKS